MEFFLHCRRCTYTEPVWLSAINFVGIFSLQVQQFCSPHVGFLRESWSSCEVPSVFEEERSSPSSSPWSGSSGRQSLKLFSRDARDERLKQSTTVDFRGEIAIKKSPLIALLRTARNSTVDSFKVWRKTSPDYSPHQHYICFPWKSFYRSLAGSFSVVCDENESENAFDPTPSELILTLKFIILINSMRREKVRKKFLSEFNQLRGTRSSEWIAAAHDISESLSSANKQWENL